MDAEHRQVALVGCARRIEGHIADQDGHPVGSAVVHTYDGWYATQTLSADASGRFSVCITTADRAWLSVEASTFGALAVPISFDARGVDVVLHPEAILTGTTTDVDGHPVPDAQVNLWPVETAKGGGLRRVARSDEDGHYRIDGIAAATYWMNAWEKEHATTTKLPLLDAQAGVLEERDLAMERTYALAGTVRREGRPLTGVKVVANVGAEGQSMHGISQADGRFTLSGVPAGPITIEVEGNTVVSPKAIEVDASTVVELDVE